MAKEKLGRRQALDRLLKIIAVATGLSVSELKSLLSSPQKELKTQKTIIFRKSANKSVKLLKVLVENSRAVFENEFGRMTPVREIPQTQLLPEIKHIFPRMPKLSEQFLEDMGDIGHLTDRNFGNPDYFKDGIIQGFICAGVNTCSGQDVDGGSGCAGTNECNGQSCDSYVCAGNDCDGQNCGTFDYCEGNKTSIVCDGEQCDQFIISVGELQQNIRDPYIQLLLDRYNVTRASDLATQLNKMFAQRRGQFRTRIR